MAYSISKTEVKSGVCEVTPILQNLIIYANANSEKTVFQTTVNLANISTLVVFYKGIRAGVGNDHTFKMYIDATTEINETLGGAGLTPYAYEIDVSGYTAEHSIKLTMNRGAGAAVTEAVQELSVYPVT